MLIIHPGNVLTLHSELKNSKSQPMFLSIAYRQTDKPIMRIKMLLMLLSKGNKINTKPYVRELSKKRCLICF